MKDRASGRVRNDDTFTFAASSYGLITHHRLVPPGFARR